MCMEQFIISLDIDTLKQGHNLLKQNNVAYELTDFSDSKGLDDEAYVVERVNKYLKHGLPEGSILMGAFHDLSIFSRDAKIRSVSFERMRQCLGIAQKLKLEMVIFYVNAPSYLLDVPDFCELLNYACEGLVPLIEEFSSIRFCFENRLEASPRLFSQLFEKLSDYTNLGFCLNYCRAALSSTSPDIWASTLQPYLRCLRIFDSNLQAQVSGQDDNLDERFNRHRGFFEKYFTGSYNQDNGKILFGYHDLHDTYVFEEEMEKIEMLEEDFEKQTIESLANSPEEMLEKIFFYMNQLVGEKGFSSTILLLTDMGRTLANSERASFWYWDRKNKQYWTIVALGRDRIVIEEGTGIVGASIQNNETLIINDPYSDERFCVQVDLASGFVSHSILCIPVMDSKGKVIGAFQAINKISEDGNGKFDEQDVRRLALSAAYCGRTLEAYLLYQETLMDSLTGLKNRRGFWEYYSEHIESSCSNNTVSLIMCDVDYFKKVNDTYGHNAGDAVLKFVANILQETVKEKGLIARWGGEEFNLMLSNTSLQEGLELAENIRACIENTVFLWEGSELKLTMSFGVTQIDTSFSIEENIEIADKKLYEAKKNGRNQVVV